MILSLQPLPIHENIAPYGQIANFTLLIHPFNSIVA
jgi:hypothetical protein